MITKDGIIGTACTAVHPNDMVCRLERKTPVGETYGSNGLSIILREFTTADDANGHEVVGGIFLVERESNILRANRTNSST